MGTTINPAVTRVSRRQWSLHVWIFAASVAAGALVSYVTLYFVIAVLRGVVGNAAAAGVVAGAIALVAGRDLGLPVPVPYRKAQVPDWIRRVAPPSLTALLYGVQLGTGFLTRFTSSAHFAFALALVFLGRGWQVFAAITAFALGKSIVIVVSAVRPGETDFDRVIDQRFPWRRNGMRFLRLTCAAVAIAVAITLASYT
jgi:hypothetical protein